MSAIAGPAPAAAAEAGFDNALASRFDGPAADRPTNLAKAGIIHAVCIAGEECSLHVERRAARLGEAGCTLVVVQAAQHPFGSAVFSFEFRAILVVPVLGLGGTFAENRLRCFGKMFGRVMVVHQFLVVVVQRVAVKVGPQTASTIAPRDPHHVRTQTRFGFLQLLLEL